MAPFAALVLIVACSIGPGPVSPPPSPSATPRPRSSPLLLRPPATAILDDASVGLPRISGRDHLSAPEAASLDSDQPLALQAYQSWGWAEQSTRAWGAGNRNADAMVLLTLRPDGARLAFDHYAQETDLPPYVGAACPPSLSGLNGCHLGSTLSRTVITGWLSEEVFVVGGSGVDVPALAAAQSRRLRA